jgi:hypothetical protein
VWGQHVRGVLLAALGCAAACVDGTAGSRITINLFHGFGPADQIAAASDPGQRYVRPHYEVWATIADAGVVRLAAVDVVPVVDPASPCLMYDGTAAQTLRQVSEGELIMAPVAPISDADSPETKAAKADKLWLQDRVRALAQSVYAVTSVSDGFAAQTQLDLGKCSGGTCWLDHAALVTGTFQLFKDDAAMAKAASCDSVGADEFCVDLASGRIAMNPAPAARYRATYRAHLVSPIPQTDPTTWSNADRLRACTISGDPDFYLGNALQLTAPRNGATYGVVDTNDPNSGAAIGGIQLRVPYDLGQATELFVTLEDHPVLAVDERNRGPLVLYGHAAGGLAKDVLDVDLVSPVDITIGGAGLGGHAAIYAGLNRGSDHF